MTMIEQPRLRIRINVETSTKWFHSYSCTVENLGATPEELREAADVALAESDRLVALLDAMYPPGRNAIRQRHASALFPPSAYGWQSG